MTKIRLAAATLPILLAASLSGCAKPAVDTAKISDTVKADVDKLVGQLNAKDIDGAVAHDAPNIVGMFHGAPNVTSPAEDKALTSAQLKDVAFHLEVANPTVDVAKAGDMAVYHATYKATFTDPRTNQAVSETGNMVSIYKPQSDGSWKVAMNIVSDTGAAPPAAPAPAPATAPEKK